MDQDHTLQFAMFLQVGGNYLQLTGKKAEARHVNTYALLYPVVEAPQIFD
jgi:hypothetical protein